MRRRTGRASGVMVAAALALAACRGDRTDAPEVQTVVDTTSAPGALVTFAVPEPMGWNQEDTIVVALANRTATAMEGARIQLVMRGAVAAVAAPPGTPGAPAIDSAGGETRVTWELGTVAQGAAVEVRQPVRTPPAPVGAAATTPVFPVRVALLSRAGAPLAAPREDTIRIRPGSERAAGGCATAGSSPAQRYGIGPVRMGMTAAALRAACPEARDTAWQGEGVAEKGLLVFLAGRAVVAQLAGDSVVRIVAVSPEVRTAAGVGIGSTLGDLRSRYGRLCALEGEGRLALWSPNAPGVSFGLAPADTAGAAAQPDSIRDDVKVATLWIHGKDTPCPARPEGTR